MVWNEFVLLYIVNQRFEGKNSHTYVTVLGDDSGVSSTLIATF